MSFFCFCFLLSPRNYIMSVILKCPFFFFMMPVCLNMMSELVVVLECQGGRLPKHFTRKSTEWGTHLLKRVWIIFSLSQTISTYLCIHNRINVQRDNHTYGKFEKLLSQELVHTYRNDTYIFGELISYTTSYLLTKAGILFTEIRPDQTLSSLNFIALKTRQQNVLQSIGFKHLPITHPKCLTFVFNWIVLALKSQL